MIESRYVRRLETENDGLRSEIDRLNAEIGRLSTEVSELAHKLEFRTSRLCKATFPNEPGDLGGTEIQWIILEWVGRWGVPDPNHGDCPPGPFQSYAAAEQRLTEYADERDRVRRIHRIVAVDWPVISPEDT